MPRWDRRKADGTVERAVLDVVIPQNPAAPGPLHIDISVAEASTADVDTARARARRPGLAAADRERTKHRRYPGCFLPPAALEAGGRWGVEFRRWARAAVPPGTQRAAALADLHQSLDVALQRGVAAALLGSAPSGARPWQEHG